VFTSQSTSSTLLYLYLHRRAEHLANISSLNGDGLDDFLYINTNGAVLMWKNKGTIPPSWGPAQLIAAGPQEGVWGTEIQFGDTDGDGKMDYAHVNRFTGAAQVWKNLGFREDGSINWAPPTPWAESIGDGVAGYSIRVVDVSRFPSLPSLRSAILTSHDHR